LINRTVKSFIYSKVDMGCTVPLFIFLCSVKINQEMLSKQNLAIKYFENYGFNFEMYYQIIYYPKAKFS